MQEFTIKQTILDYRSKEAFKTLRTNIEFSGEDTKVIFLTSTHLMKVRVQFHLNLHSHLHRME